MSLKKLMMCVVAAGLAVATSQRVFAQRHPLGDIPLDREIYNKHLKVWPLEMAEALPISYDARDEGLVTSAKNQGACGSCWAFASVGAMESHMLKAYQAGPEDLSEQQQVSCNTAMFGCDGGSANAILYWGNKGPLYEFVFPYTASDQTSCQETEGDQLGYRVIDWHTVSSSDFKNSLYTYGPSYWRFNVYDDFFDYWNTGFPGDVYANTGDSYAGGHAVLLIGWDDSKGAYLCKNSWGSTSGPNGDGTFWIAYTGHANALGFGMVNFGLTSLSCSNDADCDDGVFCNGNETCVGGVCQDGTPVSCPDDGIFCNGNEVCNEASGGCGSTGDPCGADEICNEDHNQCDSLCGNGTCDPGEDCSSCPEDCIGGATGGTCSACFKGRCDGVCHPVKEGAECADCRSSYCCGDGFCEGDEDSTNCLIDCPVPFCGDGICNQDEDPCSCPEDCGGAEICDNKIDDDCDGYVDCDDVDCSGDPSCRICVAKHESCQSDVECCSGRCLRGRCK